MLPRHESRGREFDPPVEVSVWRQRFSERAAGRRAWILAALLIAASAGLLFASLGHYAFWDDEADTAIYAHGIWETGDTSASSVITFAPIALAAFSQFEKPLHAADAVSGRGAVLWAGRIRYVLAAISDGAVRPYRRAAGRVLAVAGRSQPGFLVGVRHCAAGKCLVFLYLRQCRYYALTMLASLVIVYLYLNFRGWRSLAGILLASLVLLASQYLNYFALYVRPGRRLFPLAA